VVTLYRRDGDEMGMANTLLVVLAATAAVLALALAAAIAVSRLREGSDGRGGRAGHGRPRAGRHAKLAQVDDHLDSMDDDDDDDAISEGEIELDDVPATWGAPVAAPSRRAANANAARQPPKSAAPALPPAAWACAMDEDFQPSPGGRAAHAAAHGGSAGVPWATRASIRVHVVLEGEEAIPTDVAMGGITSTEQMLHTAFDACAETVGMVART